MGYGDGDEATVVSFGPNANNKYPTTYFRLSFEAEGIASLTELSLGIVRDDGAVIYINGVEATPRINMPAGDITYLTYASGPGVPVGGGDESTFFTYEIDPGLLKDGTNVIAVEIHQASGTSSDISFDLELTGLKASTASAPIILTEPTVVKARVYADGEWGALSETRFTVGLDALVINEVMADNGNTLEDPAEAGEFPDWIEIYNGSTSTIDLSGMYLTDNLADLGKWQIATGTFIDPGQHMIFYADDDDSQGPDHTNFRLSAGGEAIALVDIDGITVIDSVVFGSQTEDISYGRYPDGSDTWDFHSSPTPGSVNAAHGNF